MIFWTITGSLTAAILYDKREKKLAQQKWCTLVSHLADQPLAVQQMPRKLTIFLAAPPADGLLPTRDYFKEYVKPILVSAAVDYEVIEGRREGEVRAKTAERIRTWRRRAGEPSTTTVEPTTDDIVAMSRSTLGIQQEPGVGGDLVIGRNTWKEYLRGIHEGWLGPLDEPPAPEPVVEELGESAAAAVTTPITEAPKEGETPIAEEKSAEDLAKEEEAKKKKEEEEAKKKKSTQLRPYIATEAYSSTTLPPTFPPTFDPSTPLPFQHILGFLNTPIRFWRFLHRRELADSIGREVAAIVLANASREYTTTTTTESISDPSISPTASSDTTPSSTSEIITALNEEEQNWHKSIHKAATPTPLAPPYEPLWLSTPTLDERLTSRMSRFTLSAEDEARAERIGKGEEWVLGEKGPRPDFSIGLWGKMKRLFDVGEEEEVPRGIGRLGGFRRKEDGDEKQE